MRGEDTEGWKREGRQGVGSVRGDWRMAASKLVLEVSMPGLVESG